MICRLLANGSLMVGLVSLGPPYGCFAKARMIRSILARSGHHVLMAGEVQGPFPGLRFALSIIFSRATSHSLQSAACSPKPNISLQGHRRTPETPRAPHVHPFPIDSPCPTSSRTNSRAFFLSYSAGWSLLAVQAPSGPRGRRVSQTGYMYTYSLCLALCPHSFPGPTSRAAFLPRLTHVLIGGF